MKKFKRELLRLFVLYIILMAVFVFIFRTVFMLTLIPTGSMDSTIKAGDIVFATRYNDNADELNYHRLKAGGFFRAKAQTLRLKVAFGAKAPSFPD